MARAKTLTDLEKKFVDLAVEKLIITEGKVTEEDFEAISQDVGKDVALVREHANMVTSNQKPKEVEVVPVSPLAQSVRDQFSQGREGMAMMNPGLSEIIDKNPANFTVRGRNDSAVYKGNPKPKR